ncbi:MAG: hypothetical protein PUE88_02320, partial [Ruminococcus sp.]|nr:hypothetical protein [Ruminococcus sp.]
PSVSVLSCLLWFKFSAACPWLWFYQRSSFRAFDDIIIARYEDYVNTFSNKKYTKRSRLICAIVTIRAI